MKRVLLTGARGFIGSHCISLLVARGYDVHAVSRAPELEQHSGAHWHRGNLLQRGAARQLIERVQPTHLLHLAWQVEPRAFWTSSENLAWVGATLELVRSFHEGGGHRAVLAGSCAEYAWTEAEDYLDEERTPLLPTTLYGACKHATHVAAEAYARQGSLSMAWGRVFFLYGPGEARGRLVSSIIEALLSGQRAPCTTGEQLRDFLHVSDVAGAFVALLDSAGEGAFNIASGTATSVRSVVDTLASIIGRADLLDVGALRARANEPQRICGTTSRLRSVSDWEPQFDIVSGLRDTVARWARMQLP